MSYDKEKINKDNSVSDTDAELDVVDDAEFVLSDKMEYEDEIDVESKIVDRYPDDSFVKYLMRQTPPTHEENCELIKRIQNGDKKAKDEFLIRNGKLAISLVCKLAPVETTTIDMDDMIQQAFIGMITAVERFDLSLNIKFSTYAYQWIRQSLWRYYGNANGAIRIPIHAHSVINKINKIKTECIQTGKPIPTVKEFAEMLNTSEESIKAAMHASETAASLDANIGEEDSGSTLSDFVADEHNIELSYIESNLSANVRDAFEKSSLSPKEKTVIIERFGLINGEQKTLAQVGMIMGVSRERIRQIESVALKKLSRNPEFRNLAADYFNVNPRKLIFSNNKRL